MLTKLQQMKRSRAGVRRWYGENREEYNSLRRKRYAQNKDARDKARLRAAKYRKSGVSIEREVVRVVDGKTVVVLSTGQVAELMDRSPQMLRNWEREGLIPKATFFYDAHRFYTKKQARMIITLGSIIKRNGGSWNSTQSLKYRASLYERW